MKKQRQPMFIVRDDGLGWNLNFDRPIAYFILACFIALIIGFGIYCTFYLKG
ncbi:hypothetical protein BDD43_5118 [Mucilaginibacter gracilis]|uniref:DUF5808 domain-containing protein n=1 Tax=Mucilaginibacter gracilis TaxID=423350 RepID=A0A495J795_9SPHI|nr:hypothetical protein BDD43_5118 [Mucilaginibacter gracilis]